MYFNSDIVPGKWLTEQCSMCGSINHIFTTIPEAHAWECWCCGSKFWLDELGKDFYIIQESIDDDEAERMLNSGDLSITFLNGQCER